MSKETGRTLDYYDQNARAYRDDTVNVPMKYSYDRFLFYLPETGRLLDFGCGSGRDTKFFLEKGFEVDAVDGSAEQAKIAEELTSHPVRVMRFTELDAGNTYEGIWACASILHCPWDELTEVFGRMLKALKKEGVIYASFKLGDFEGYRGERYYTDLDVERLYRLLSRYENCLLLECWKSHDGRPERFEEMWLNFIVRRIV